MRFLFAIVLALGIAAAAYGAAAALTVNGGTIASGSTAAACDSSVNIEYTLTGTNVDTIKVTGIDGDACQGQDVIVDTDAGSDTDLDGTCANLNQGTTTATVGQNTNGVAAGNINGVSVTIASTAATANTNCTPS
jgi:hypothetical protein